MKKVILTLFLLVGFTYIHAQYSSQEWHNGYIVTTEKDTVRGKINYDMEANIVQVSVRNSVKAYSSYKILYFQIFDVILQSYRQFYTLPYALKTRYETPVLFEVLYEGELSLLAREKIVQETATVGTPMWSNARVMQDRLDYDFFFLSRDGKMTFYNGQRSELYEILKDKKSEVRDFVKTNNLKTDVMRDLIRITSFYNSI